MIPVKGALVDNTGKSFALNPPAKGQGNNDEKGSIGHQYVPETAEKAG